MEEILDVIKICGHLNVHCYLFLINPQHWNIFVLLVFSSGASNKG